MKIFCKLNIDNRVIGSYLEGHPEIIPEMLEITEEQHIEVMTLEGRAGIVNNIIVDMGESPGEVDEVSKAALEEVAADILLKQLKNITPNQAHAYVMNPNNDLRIIVAALAKYITWRHK